MLPAFVVMASPIGYGIVAQLIEGVGADYAVAGDELPVLGEHLKGHAHAQDA
jgi:hypothetical protein